MTPIKAAMQRQRLTVADVALLTGSTTRMVEYWRAGRWPPPKAVMLILIALEQGKIDIDWLAQQLEVTP